MSIRIIVQSDDGPADRAFLAHLADCIEHRVEMSANVLALTQLMATRKNPCAYVLVGSDEWAAADREKREQDRGERA